ncbi:hypothetical protein LCGC14_2439520 [marine sediment metagenome]|uniref:Uncharacterized protein n=1 Tax=marine sediment metagenome TaxID=412755 RepID=A0A0F9C6U7_9ZZZZ
MTIKAPTQNVSRGGSIKTSCVFVSTKGSMTPFCVGTYPLIWTETYMLYALKGS